MGKRLQQVLSLASLAQAVARYWPWILPVLVAVAQFFEPVPLPYLAVGVAVAIAMAVIAMNGLQSIERLDEVFIPRVAELVQFIDPNDKTKCGFQLTLLFINSGKKPIFAQLDRSAFSFGGRSKPSVDIVKTAEMLPPGIPSSVILPTIDGLKPGGHSGHFEAIIAVGRKFGRRERILEWQGQIDMGVEFNQPVNATVPFRMKGVKSVWRQAED